MSSPRGQKLKEIIIPIMGPTGAGKSTFVNTLLGQDLAKVGHSLTSCTAELQAIPYEYKGLRIMIVDTPGFDDTYEGDSIILKRIADWLKEHYRQKKVLGGVLYLHDISAKRFTGTARRNLEMFKHMCGEDAFKVVVLGTTNWVDRSTQPDTQPNNFTMAVDREREFKVEHWKSMIDQGAQVHRFLRTRDSAHQFIDLILDRIMNETLQTALAALQIQQELVVQKKILAETKAAKELRFTLQEVVEMQKQLARYNANEEMQERIDKIINQINQLKVPFTRKLRKLFGL